MDDLEKVSERLDDILMEHQADVVEFMDPGTVSRLYKLLITELVTVNETIKEELCE